MGDDEEARAREIAPAATYVLPEKRSAVVAGVYKSAKSLKGLVLPR